LDVDEFLELEKPIYLDMFTNKKAIFDDEEEEEDTEMDSTKKIQWKLQMRLRMVKENRKEDWRRWILVRIAVMMMPVVVMNTVNTTE
jgi:hypothetical protein